MNSQKRFLVGGGGALMPVLISILAIDVGAVLGSDSSLSTANIIGIFIRYFVLFVIGGVVAFLHEDETNSFKLFELGVAAPALLTSLISAQGIITDTNQDRSISFFDNISLVSSAYAGTEIQVAKTSFLGDVFQGISGQAYSNKNKKTYKSSSSSTKRASTKKTPKPKQKKSAEKKYKK